MRTPEQLAALIAQFDNDMVTKTKWYRFWLAIDQLGKRGLTIQPKSILVVFSIGMFIMMVLVKFGIVMWKESKRPEVPTKVQGLTLEVNSLNKWQEMKDQQIKELGDDLKSVEANVTTKMDELQKTISTELNSTQANVNESLIVLQSSNKQVINEALTDIKNEIRNMGEETKQYTDQKNLTISEKIAQIESKKGESAKLAVLPPLPPLQNSSCIVTGKQ